MDLSLTTKRPRQSVRDEAGLCASAFAQAGIDDITIDAITQRDRGVRARHSRSGPDTVRQAGSRETATVFNEAQERGPHDLLHAGPVRHLPFRSRTSRTAWFHNIGTGTADDPGRFEYQQRRLRLSARSRRPALRNWKGREPFMHDGRFETLDDVLGVLQRAQDRTRLGQTELDPLDSEQAGSIPTSRRSSTTLNGAWPDLAAYEAAWQAAAIGPICAAEQPRDS